MNQQLMRKDPEELRKIRLAKKETPYVPVVAAREGYYESRYHTKGSEFNCREGELGSWMLRLDGKDNPSVEKMREASKLNPELAMGGHLAAKSMAEAAANHQAELARRKAAHEAAEAAKVVPFIVAPVVVVPESKGPEGLV